MTASADLQQFFVRLKGRNRTLFFFGLLNFAVAAVLFAASLFIEIEFSGTHAFYKPVKFGLSIGIYSWTMAWLISYLGDRFHHKIFSWGIVLLLGFEILYIAIQALRGEASHFNVGTSFYKFMYVLMAVAAALVSAWTAFIGVLFASRKFPDLPVRYLWGIRFGILIFVIFSFEGFLMGSRLSHTVGALDGSDGYWFLNWSKQFGDLRISHFLGMHALQVIPILSFYFFRSTQAVVVFSLGYLSLASFALYVALLGRAFI